MQTVDLYPPYIYLHQIADHLPETLQAYLFLWRSQKDGRVIVTKDEVTNLHFLPWRKFQNDVRKLALNDLLNYVWADDTLVIELAQFNGENDVECLYS